MVPSMVEREKYILNMLLPINQDNWFFLVSTNKIGVEMTGNILKSEGSKAHDNYISL